jgi:hypothetical protein
MKTETAHCSGCGHKVRLVFTDPPPHTGHANLREEAEIVCLDYKEECAGGQCSMTGKAGIIMGVRLARSHLRDEVFTHIHARCEGCGEISDLEVIDERYAMCTLCNTTNTWMTMRLADDTDITLTGR